MGPSIRSTALALACRVWTALAGTIATDAWANPADVFGLGSRSSALGGAVAADVSDFSANYYNPAGLVRARGLAISVGYFHASHELEMNGRSNEVDPVRGLVFGFVAPGTLAKVPVAIGMALHLPDDRISRVRALRQEQPRWELYDNRNQRLFLAANVAIEPWDWLALGGGFSFMASTRGRLDVTGRADLFDVERSELRHQIDADLGAVRYPQLGARVRLGKSAAIAFVYRGEFRLGLDLGAAVEASLSDLTTAHYRLQTSSVNNFLPEQVVVGSSWVFTPRWTANFDLTWIHWSAYVPPVASLGVVLDIPPPEGGWPRGIVPPETPTASPVVAIGMRDRLVPRLGVEWLAIEHPSFSGRARVGYEFAKSPLSAQTGITNYADGDRQTLSVGLGAAIVTRDSWLPAIVDLDVHGQISAIAERRHEKASAADLVGDYVSRGNLWSIGCTAGVRFQ